MHRFFIVLALLSLEAALYSGLLAGTPCYFPLHILIPMLFEGE